MRTTKHSTWMMAALLAGCADVAEVDEQTGSTSDEIINGTAVTANRYNAAVYHYQDRPGFTGWWPRPCTGTIIRRVNTSHPSWTYILTSRHCVTLNGKINGKLVQSREQVRVTTAISPGPSQQAAPPGDTLQAAVFAHGSPAHEADYAQDVAILTVPSYLDFGPYDFGVQWTAPAPNNRVAVYAYGRSVEGYDADDPIPDQQGATGAGTLRSAVLQIASVSTGSYAVTLPNGSGQELTHGDSGSGQFKVNASGPHYLLGVTTNDIASTAGGVSIADWLQTKLGYLHLAKLDYQNSQLLGVTGTPAAGNQLYWNRPKTDDLLGTQVTYVRSSKRIKIGTFCVTDSGNGEAAKLQNCDGSSAQKWSIGSDLKITNVGSGRCLHHHANNTVTTASCQSSDTWIWLTD